MTAVGLGTLHAALSQASRRTLGRWDTEKLMLAKLTTSFKTSLSKLKRHKAENRQFQSERTKKYLFTLPAATSNKLVCGFVVQRKLCCDEKIVKRHHKSNHGLFSGSPTEGSEEFIC